MKRWIGQSTENDEDEIDRMLSREDEILPSSGFALSVMDAVRREAAAPPPIPFPWKRALPGLVVVGVALALALVAVVTAIVQTIVQTSRVTTPQSSPSVPSVMPALFNGSMESALIWIGLALLTAFVSVKLSMRLAFGRA
jgi:hypothetical protein